ncbi:MAG TPA: PH domain-containing protein [Marmoricola sp.]|nr:PH domain-containing protein [Marmoricola sp.]
MDDLFAPPGSPWQRVSPRLAVVRRWLLLVAALLGVVVAVALHLLLDGPWWLLTAVLAVGAVLLGWAWWLVGRNARRWGYAEEDEELYITRGALFRKLVVVPYGRMQYVDVEAGPLDQANGIAKLHLHTASPGTTAVIPGLRAEEAARLRDRLTARGESRAAGL